MIPRYSRPDMVAIWAPETKFRIWFEIEAHACDAQAKLGVIANRVKRNTVMYHALMRFLDSLGVPIVAVCGGPSAARGDAPRRAARRLPVRCLREAMCVKKITRRGDARISGDRE